MAKRDVDYDKVISEDNLIRAWDHVRYDAGDDYALDVFGYDDVGSNINELIKTIHDILSFDNYQASSLKHVEVPKSILAVRPGSVPEIKDRIVSYAIINIIAQKIDSKFSDSVYSYLNRIRCATYTLSNVSLNSPLMQYWCYPAHYLRYFSSVKFI